MEVAYIVSDHEKHSIDADEIALGHPHVPLAGSHAAFAFYHDNREAIRAMIREDRAAIAHNRRSSA